MNSSEELMNPLSHMRPSIRISPFSGSYFDHILKFQAGELDACAIIRPNYWLDHAAQLQFYSSGRSALKAALISSGITRSDSIMIITTTGGDYISSCVTKTIEQVCEWSRTLQPNTKAVVIIHELGFPCLIPDEVLDRGLTIIEDCAYAVGTRLEGGAIGCVGDFAIYSLTKYYPIPFGGLLVSRAEIGSSLKSEQLSVEAKHLVEKCLINATAMHVKWNHQRQNNWRYFAAHMESLGLHEYFKLDETVVPGVFVVNLGQTSSGALIKKHCVEAGIESTEYYGQNGFYFPVHQYLSDYDKDYICYHFMQGVNSKK